MSLVKENQDYRGTLIEIGQYINDYRVRRKLSIQQMSVRVGVNPSYLREVERGEKIPDDYFIRNLSEQFGLDENYIFGLLGKTTLVAREELDQHALLQQILTEIGMSSFPEQKKQELYEMFYSLTKKALINQVNIQN
ncbi:helix-turn-helix domain-containing protein [Desulfitobacterium sp. AusDCA]|uniref:helix-turn-helix domain-containing protein n=1 Tax=Desulfitobacterium sp. AusDCA TaxID=3240383 RepID=UPI003DA784B2